MAGDTTCRTARSSERVVPISTTDDSALPTAADTTATRPTRLTQGAPGRLHRAVPQPPTGRAAVTEIIEHPARIDAPDDEPRAHLALADAVAVVSATALALLDDDADPGPAAPPWRPDAELDQRLAGLLRFGLQPSSDLRFHVSVYGIDTEREYIAFRARPDGARPDAPRLGDRADALRGHRRDPCGTCGTMLAEFDGDLIGFTATPPPDVPGATIGVGPPRPLDRLPESFHLACRAVDSASAFGLTGRHSIESLGLLPTILADRDVGDALRERYLTPLAGLESSDKVLTTLRAYFECGMRVERAAKVLYMHANTVRYRIARFEAATGASLRDPVTAMEVWWSLRHAELRRPGGVPATGGAA